MRLVIHNICRPSCISCPCDCWAVQWPTFTTRFTHGAEPILRSCQLSNYSRAFYGTRRFITVFTRALHWSLSWARSIQPMLSTHIRLGLPSGLFPFSFSHQYPICIPLLPHSCYMPSPMPDVWQWNMDSQMNRWKTAGSSRVTVSALCSRFMLYGNVPQPVCRGKLVCRHKVKGVTRTFTYCKKFCLMMIK
jgi:hypothetical protein